MASSSSANSNEVSSLTSGHVREKLDNASPLDLRVIAEAGLIPPKWTPMFADFHNEYDPKWGEDKEDYDSSDDPQYAHHTENYQKWVRRLASEYVSKAVENGNTSVKSNFIGIVEEKSNIENLHPVSRFLRFVKRKAGVNYIFAAPGHGKTDFGVTIVENFYKEFSAGEQPVQIATNLQSLAEEFPDEKVIYINNFPEMQKWINNDDNKYKHVLLDEMSHHAHAFSGNNQEVVDKLGTMIKFIRKNKGSMTIIGHSGKDVAPEIRDLSDPVEKEDQKTAVVYEDVEDREGINQKDKFTGIPKANWPYRTDERSEWSWGETEEEEKNWDLFIAKTYMRAQEGKINSQSDVAEIFDISQSKVSQIVNEFEDELAA